MVTLTKDTSNIKLVQVVDDDGVATAIGGGGGASFTAVSGGTLAVTAGTNKPGAIDLYSHLGVVNYDTDGNALDPNAALPAGSNIIGNVGIDQTTAGTTNGVVVNSSALPTGAATGANQTTGLASLASVDGGIGGAAAAAATGSGASTTNGFLRYLRDAVAAILNVQGDVAAAAADGSSKPVKIGGRYNTTLPVLTDGLRGDAQLTVNGALRVNAGVLSVSSNDTMGGNIGYFPRVDQVGGTGAAPVGVAGHVFDAPGATWLRQRGDVAGTVMQPYAVRTLRWSYAAATGGILNTTTAVTIVAANATLRNAITGVSIMAEALGAATELAIRDGAGGTVLWRIKIPMGGLPLTNIVFPTPLINAAANTLLEVVTLTASVTGAVYVNATGYAQ